MRLRAGAGAYEADEDSNEEVRDRHGGATPPEEWAAACAR